jgi:N12 class adenine-specific DNA methylase
VSIVDPTRSFTRNGLQVNVVVDQERKAPTVKWEENEHPRDREGKFIETFARVRVWGGKLATVLRNVGGGRIEIEYDDKTHATIHRNYLTVVKRPDGTAPTSKRGADIRALPQKQPGPDAVAIPHPTTAPDADMGDVHEGLDHFLRKLDPDLAGRVESASNDYQAALGNGIPDDEADERARLIEALDEVDQKHGTDRRVAMMSSALRTEALKEPDGQPADVDTIARQQANDEPVTVRPAGTPDPGVPIPPPPAAEKPETESIAARQVNKGDVLHTRLGRVTVVEQPKRQPNQEYVLVVDRGNGKRTERLTLGSRDRVDREVAPAADQTPSPESPATPTPPAGVPGSPNAQRITPDAPLTDTPAAPDANKPAEPDAPRTRKYRTTKLGAREAAYAAEVQDTDGYQSGLTVNGQIVTVTDPESALWSLVGIRDIHSDNLSESARDYLDAAERRNARASATALTNLMNAIRRDYGIEGDGKPSPRIDDGDTSTPDAPNAPDVPAAPEAAKPDAPQPPVKPERRQLDGFSAAESARIHNAVEDHATLYAGRPGANANRDDVARYVSEGHLNDLVADHGLPKVWRAARSVIDDDPSVMAMSREDLDRVKGERETKLDELNRAAGAAAQAGNWDEALRGLDEMETIDPMYRPGGLAIDDLRGRLTRMRDAEPQHQDAPDNAPGNAPDVTPDTAPDAAAPEVPGGAGPVAVEDLKVGDVIDFGGTHYTVTTSQPDQRDPRDWHFAASDENGRQITRRVPRGQTWQRVSSSEAPDQQNGTEAPNAAAPAEPATPDVPPQAASQPNDSAPRFPDVEAVRERLRSRDAIPQSIRDTPDRANAVYENNVRIADDPGLTLSAQGRLIVHRNATQNGDKEWRIAAPGSAMWLGPAVGTAKTKDEALQLANLYEAHVDKDGKPFPFDQDDAQQQVRTWKADNGSKIGPLLQADRNRVPKGTRAKRGDWSDPWWRGETPQSNAPEATNVPTPPPTPDTAAPNAPETGRLTYRLGNRDREYPEPPRDREVQELGDGAGIAVRGIGSGWDVYQPIDESDVEGGLGPRGEMVYQHNGRLYVDRGDQASSLSQAQSRFGRGEANTPEATAPAADTVPDNTPPGPDPRTDQEWEEIGRQAHRDGGLASPAANGQVQEALADRRVGDPENVRIMSAFSRGWDADNDPANINLPDSPNDTATPDNAVTVDSLDDSRGGIGRDRSQWYRIDWDNDRDNAEGLYADNPARNRPIQVRATHAASDLNSEAPQPGDRRVLFTNDQGASGDLVLPSGTRLIPVDAPDNAPEAPNVSTPPPAPDADAPDADVDVPAVPPADAEPSAPAAPRAPGDGGRWNIAPVETTGDEETDKRALAANLRAAARSATSAEDRAALNWAARQLDPPKPRPRPATDGSAPAPRRRASSPRAQARAQADSDVATARRTRKPPVSAEARMAALADLADELDRLGLGSVAVTPSDDGGDGGQTGGRKSLVTVLRQYVAEYKQRRAEVASGGGAEGATTEGGGDGSDSGSGGGALQEVPAADVPGVGGPGGVLPESGDGGAGPDRRPDGSVRGAGPAGGDVRGPGGEAEQRPAASGGTGDAGDRPAGPGDGSDRGPGEGDRVPAEPRSADATGAGDTGGPAVGAGDERLAGRDSGTGGDQAAADEPPARSDDAGEPADGVTEADQPAPEPTAVPVAAGGNDFRPSGVEDFAPAGKMGKLNANLAALRLLRQLQREKRPTATPDEQAVLAKWAGWGGLPEVFDPTRADYAAQREELRGLMSEKEWYEARRNTLNAHYTDARVVSSVWDAVRQLGFDGGRVLEPGSGSGTFIGLAPDNANMVGVELDSTTAALSQYLYPNATIRNESFARTNLPDGSFDMTIGNVPFGDFPLTDRRHNPDGESIHNHFILKSMDLTRPGGLVAVLTSRYTLDTQSSRARRKMAEKADLVGAVRLPTGSHQRASGTDVIEDLLIFRVRGEGETPQADQSWVTSSKRDVNGFEISVNNYWAEHPENVLGEFTADKGQYGTGDLRVRGDKDMTDLPAVLSGIVDSAREEGLTATASTGDRPDLVEADESRHDGHIRQEEDGSFTQAVNGASVPFEAPASQREELASLIGLRDTLGRLLDAESANQKDTPEILSLRQRLNTQYDEYVAKNGPINRYKLGKTGNRIRPGQGNFRRDPMSAVVRALETYDPSTGTAEKASIFTKRAIAPRELRTTTDSPADAISLSMDAHGEVNLPAIAAMLGTDEATARERLGTLVFEEPPTTANLADLATRDVLGIAGMDPSLAGTPKVEIDHDRIGELQRLEPAAAYLSGNVRKKLAVAEAAAAVDPRFQANVDALKAVIPEDLTPLEIDGRLGAAWIPPETIQQFLSELVEDRHGQVKVVNHGGSIWTVEGPSYGNLSTEVWGTEKRSAAELVQSLLEQRSIKVTRSVIDIDGNKKNIPDPEATLAAQEKAEAIQERFSEWLWEDATRADDLQKRYNDQFNAIVLRKYDGSGRSFQGMAASWVNRPREHQRNAVERIVNEPTALLGHVVGAGKTAEMVMGTAELKRLGMARKPAIVVPNHMLEQFTREYLEIYPQARILAAGTDDLQGDKRREFVGRAATGDWDAVILTQGAFEKIPLSQEEQESYIDRELATMRAQFAQAEAAAAADAGPYGAPSQAHKKTVKKMENALLRAEEAMRKKLDKQKDVGVSWEQTGIDYLMVDEAHGYSNLRVLSNIQGAGNVGSDRATDLHMKLEYLRKTSRSGRVATFATGTPIRNTVTQAYVMQRFLRPDLLEEAGITSFDQWAATFGQVVDEMELKPEGTGFRQTQRFAKFRNVPELLKQFHTFADIKLAEDLDLPTPNLEGGKAQAVVVPGSDALAEYIAELGERAEAVRSGAVEPEEDNMLKISGDGRKAALSMQLVGGDHEPGKIEAAADRIASIWTQNKDRVYTDPDTGEDDPVKGALQIVFMDLGTPGGEDRWNGYDALKGELVARGMDPSSIRYIHEAKNDAQKAELFAMARSGRIAVLLGSSEKMGVGTNIQKRALAMHHLDAPWRPADVDQRDGRIMRQGNLNPDVQIFRYVTEKSFDTYMWQTLERKAKFINQIMKGSLDVREIEDIGDTAMNAQEIKALSSGNPDILEKAKTDTLLAKLTRLERTHNQTQRNLKTSIQTSTANAQTWESFAAQYDAAIPQRIDTRGDKFTMNVSGSRYNKRQDAADALRARVYSIRNQDRWGDAPARDIGTVGGFTVTGQVVHAPGGARDVIIRFDGVPGEITRLTADDLDQSGYGIISRLESALEGFETKRDRLLQSAADARLEVQRMEARLGQEFPRAAELAAARLKSERLNLKMERAIRREAGEEIPFDPLIDSDQYDPAILSTAEDADIPPEDFGATTGADLRRAAEARADAEKTLAIVNGRVIVKLITRKVAA